MAKGQKPETTFTIDAGKVLGENTEFWKAAGSDHLFYHVTRPSGQSLLDRMEATKSHKFLRTHHTFVQDRKKGVLRGQNVYSENKNGNPVYDFSNVNKVFGEYVKRGLKPIVEYDYLPRQLENKTNEGSNGNDEGMKMQNMGPNDWKKWSDLMKAATQNFIDVFGAEEVRTWYFEVWNEPDGWPQDQMDVFYKMYDVFVDAVTSVNNEFRVGGPACYHDYFLRPFLNHVVNGTNHVTGGKGTRIDFISYHIYGLSGKWLNSEPHIQPQVQRFSQSILWLKRLMKDFPELKGTEFHINEWGMSSNFYRTVEDHPDLVYRNNEESPLFLVKLVNSLYQIEDKYNFPISILLYWGFCGEADANEVFAGKRELTIAGNIPKPVQTGFEMLAQLKEKRIQVLRQKKDSRFGVLATKSSNGEMALIAYNYNETDRGVENKQKVILQFTGLKPNSTYHVEQTKLDQNNNNTYSAWEKAGSPASLSKAGIAKLSDAASLNSRQIEDFVTDNNGNAKVEIDMATHTMQLLEIEKSTRF
jgi:xylan 1,4-beta-xylosidase